MKEEERLLNLDIEKELQKQSLSQPEGIKLYFFRALYSLLQNKQLNQFCDMLFTFFEFIQLMAFPMDKIFSSGWKNFMFGIIGNFFRYSQLISLWLGNSQVYLISYILTCLYILILLVAFIHVLINSALMSSHLNLSNKIISLLLEFEIILYIPFLKLLFGIFTCENGNLQSIPNIKCKSSMHFALMIISIIFSVIFVVLMILFRSTLFEFGRCNGKFKAAYTSSTEVLLEISKFLLIILYQFIKKEIPLAIITFILSLLLFIHFLNKQPFSNGFTMKVYFTLYLLFFWSSSICILAVLLRNSKFEGGILLLLIGYPFIIISVSIKEWDFSFDKIFEYLESKEKDGYKALLEIEYFLKMEEGLEDKIRTSEQKVLYSYISNYEKNCPLIECPLKQFMKIPLKVENFVEMKICLLQHGEILFKNALSKFPFNTKLRLSHGLFLFNKLNKKLKGTVEITLLNKYDTNLEESFLVYKAQRYIQEENEGTSESSKSSISSQESNSSVVNSYTYKSTLNNIRSLIGRITMNYIDFWTILTINNENKSENFLKMSAIGTKIKQLNEELVENIDKLETVNLYDQDTFKLYIQYLIQILSDNSKAILYSNKLSENVQKKHQYNEENLFELNFKAMSKSEDYKYIVIDCSHSNFDRICNLSLSVCPIFGYAREELIGNNYNCLLPELFSFSHRQMLEEKIEEFKKKILIKKNAKIRSEIWVEESYAKTKMKYLMPIKTRWTLVVSEEDLIYAIGKIIQDNKEAMELDQEEVYILTDKDLIIRNFSSNAPKLLLLHSSAINNNLDITNFIKEFNEDNISHFDSPEEIKGSIISSFSQNNKKRIKYIKSEILKKMFLGAKEKKVIHWRLGDIIANEINKGNKKVVNKRISFARANFNENTSTRFQSAFFEYTGKTLKPKNKVVPKRKKSVSGILQSENDKMALKKLNSSNTEEKLPNLDQEKIIEFKDTNISDINLDASFIINDHKNLKDKILYQRPIHYKFSLSVKEIKFKEHSLGYIFKFEPYFSKSIEETNVNKINQLPKFDLSVINKQENNDIEKSDISFISFAGKKQNDKKYSLIYSSPDNPFGINSHNIDEIFGMINIEKEEEFTIDVDKMVYKQLRNIDKGEELGLYESLRQEAVKKVSNAARKLNKEEVSEEEEESSSGSYISSDEESSKNSDELSSGIKMEEESSQQSKELISIKSPKKVPEEKHISLKNVINLAPSATPNIAELNPLNINSTINKKKQEEDYYHVDFSKITYYIYNYISGFTEVVKESKYKVSEVVKKINSEKEKMGKLNSKYIANPKLAKEKKKGNINKKISNEGDELNYNSEQTIKLREIQKALTSKEKQTIIVNLCVFSFIIFAVIIASGVMSILINYHLKGKSFLFYNLIKQAIQLYKNILIEINNVREIIIINSTYYNNFYESNKTKYFQNYSEECYQYYLDTSHIISNLTTSINTLNERQRELLINQNINCYILDPIESHGLVNRPKRYELQIFSAYRELNSALYHISQLKMEEVYTYDESIYFFIKNGMSNIIIYVENLLKTLTNEFYDVVKNGYIIIIICLVAIFIAYTTCFFFLKYFFEKVEERKQSYLSVFYEIGGEYIILSLAKCEKFSQKLQTQEDNAGGQGEKISLDSSSTDESDIDNDIQSSSIFKQKKENKINISNKEKTSNNISLLKARVTCFILFFILLIWQYSSYVYYYLRLSLYKNCVHYEFHLTNYFSSFIFPFIGIREYIYDTNKTFYNKPVNLYIEEELETFYTDLSTASNNKDKFVKYFPKSYQDFLDFLYSDEICKFINEFNEEYPENGISDCNDFFYGSSNYGFFAILTMYIEEIRYIKDFADQYWLKAKQNNFKYNESFYNDPNGYYYDLIYKNYTEVIDTYREVNPANALHLSSHKTIVIVYRFIISKVMIIALDQMFLTFEGIFDSTTKVSLIINIAFIAIVFLGFSFIWLPLVLDENETIFKTKNMLSIIPNEILITLPHIDIMLGIDEESN